MKKKSSKNHIMRRMLMRKKTLPELDDKMPLSRYGYTLKNPAEKRQKSLKRASKDYSTLSVLRRVNLIRNYSKAVKPNYKKLSTDVDFMKKEYSKEKSKKNKK